MSRSLRRHTASWLWVAATALTSGCASFAPPAPEPPSERVAQLWRQHSHSVRAQTDWVLNARIVASSEDDSWNGKLYWQQAKDRYKVSFVAPFGQGGMQLDGKPGQVEMRTSDGHVLVAADAESLLYEQLGWQFPLAKLRYWVRGIPAPSSHNMPVLAFDDAGRLSRLRQADWRIDYPAYQQTEGQMLPRKVFLENTELSVRLVVDHWAGHRGQ